MRRFSRVLLLFAIMFAAAGFAPAQVPDVADAAFAVQAMGSIEVHARMCDEVPADGDWYSACHDNLAVDVYFEAMNTATMETESGITGADGSVTFTLFPGTWQLSGPPGDFLEATVIYCSMGANMPEIAHPVALSGGDAVICDYYFVPDDASGAGTIEVHARMCDAVPADGDWYDACHDDLAVDVWFDAIETTTGEAYNGTTGAGGDVTFTLPPGTWQLSGPPGDFMEATFIYCSTGENTPEVAHPVALGAGEFVICDYYFVPDRSSGPTPTPTATAAPTVAPTAAPREPDLELPVVIVAGTCGDVTDATEIVAELSDAVVLEGDAEGSDEAIQAATSYTRVSISLRTMVGADHVIAVLDEDGEAVVACGAIGGVPDGQGAFTVGLAPVDDSGVAGTAYLAAREGNTTGISIFVVPEGLLPEPILEPVG